jgi:hypothetical protein
VDDFEPADDREELRSTWETFCDRLRDGAEVVLDPARPTDAADRTEGIRHLLRRLQIAIGAEAEGGDHTHPELAWTHPSKTGQDNPMASTRRLSAPTGCSGP